MPSHFSEDAIEEAVERLQSSRVKPSVCDFLIVKRALVRGESDVVTLSKVDPHLKGATLDLTLALPEGYEGDATANEPYFNPFGSAQERRGGWRTHKYISNGPADTVTGPGWRDVIEQIPDAKPRQIQLKAGYEDAIGGLLVPKKVGDYPEILDAAVWFYRFADLDDIFGAGASDDAVVQGFVDSVGLTADERAILFSG